MVHCIVYLINKKEKKGKKAKRNREKKENQKITKSVVNLQCQQITGEFLLGPHRLNPRSAGETIEKAVKIVTSISK